MRNAQAWRVAERCIIAARWRRCAQHRASAPLRMSLSGGEGAARVRWALATRASISFSTAMLIPPAAQHRHAGACAAPPSYLISRSARHLLARRRARAAASSRMAGNLLREHARGGLARIAGVQRKTDDMVAASARARCA